MQFKIPYEHRKASGIYAIINLVNGKVYIGSAVNFAQRFMNHVSYCRRGKQNSKFQRAINKYGVGNFAFTLMEFCEKADLVKREQHWISELDSYKNGYNGTPNAGSSIGIKRTAEQVETLRQRNKILKTGTKASPETKLKMRLARLGRNHSKQTIEKLIHRKERFMKKVNQYDLNGGLIQQWPSIISAKRAGFNNIQRAIKNPNSKPYGFIWRLAA